MKSSLEAIEVINQGRLQKIAQDNAEGNYYYWREEIPGFWEATCRAVGMAEGICVFCWIGFSLLSSALGATGAYLGEYLAAFLAILVLPFFVFRFTRFLASTLSVFVFKLFESLEMQSDRLHVAILVGGLTGVLATSVLFFPAALGGPFSPPQMLILLATVAGQTGAAIAAAGVLRRESPDPEAIDRLPRFSLRYLMMTMFVLALCFGALKYIGAPIERLLSFFAIWVGVLLITELILLGIGRGVRAIANLRSFT